LQTRYHRNVSAHGNWYREGAKIGHDKFIFMPFFQGEKNQRDKLISLPLFQATVDDLRPRESLHVEFFLHFF